MAGGFSFDEKFLTEIKFNLENYFNNVSIKKREFLEVDTVLDLNYVTISLIKNIKNIGPFGQDNEEPIIVLNNLKPVFVKKTGMLEKHIFCVLEDNYGGTINGIAFNQSNTVLGNAIFRMKPINIAGKLEIYESEKIVKPQIIIEDILNL